MQKQYYKQFDSLRFLAMLAIIFYHYMKSALPGGFLAVEFFFIISGYFITRKMTDQYELDQPMHLGTTFLKRLWHLFVPMVFMVVMVLLYLLIFRFDLLTNTLWPVLSSLGFFNNWYQVAAGASYFEEFLHPSTFTHLWYLGVYAQLILFWPIFYRLLLPICRHKKMRLGVTLGLCVLSAVIMAFLFVPGQDPTRVYYGTDTRFMSFGLGAALAIFQDFVAYKEIKKQIQPWLKGLVAFVLLVLLYVLMGFMQDGATFTYYGGMFLFDLLAVGALAFLLEEHWLSKILSFKPLVWLGKRTYMVYLWYYPIYILCYMGAKTQNLFTKNIYLQVLFIFLLAIVTYVMVDLKTFQIPFFKSAQWGGVREELAKLVSPTTPLYQKVLFWAWTLCLLGSGIVLAVAPSQDRHLAEQQNSAKTQPSVTQEAKQAASAKQAKQADSMDLVDLEVEEHIAGLSDAYATLFTNLSVEEASFAYHSAVTFIGDSLTLGMRDATRALFPKAYIDGEVGRQMVQVQNVASSLAAAGELAPNVVINMGANGGFSVDQVKNLIETIGENKEIYFVNTHVNRPWRDEVNNVLKEAIKDAGKHVHLVDWYAYYQKNVDPATWLTPDAVHFEFEGQKHWLDLLIKEMAKSQPEKVKELAKNFKKRPEKTSSTESSTAPEAASNEAGESSGADKDQAESNQAAVNSGQDHSNE